MPGIRNKKKGVRITLFHADGTQEALDSDESLQKMQQAVKGYVEVLQLDDSRTMLINEEGLLRQMPPNLLASQMAGHLLVGPVVLLENSREWR